MSLPTAISTACSAPKLAAVAQVPDGVWEIGQSAPLFWREASGPDRISLEDDRCVVRIGADETHFLRGRLAVPVQKVGRNFSWLIWVSVSAPTWSTVSAAWEDPARAKLKPFFGWLSSELPFETTTVGLPTTVSLNPRGELPSVWVNISSRHPLGTEQRQGITAERLEGIRRGDVRMN